MKTDITMNNTSFSFLKGSSEFLNVVLDNISVCVLLCDKDMKLRVFNDAMKTLFSNKKDEDLLYMRCGEAIGCAYQIEEQKNCGETSRCSKCELRVAALTSYANNEPVFKEHVVRPFYNFKAEKVDKHLQFSTRLFIFEKEKYIMLLIEDVTKFDELGTTSMN